MQGGRAGGRVEGRDGVRAGVMNMRVFATYCQFTFESRVDSNCFIIAFFGCQ